MARGASKEQRLEGSFVTTDEKGEEHTLHVYGNYNISRSLTGSEQATRTTFVIQTEDGRSVSPTGDGKYRVSGTALILHTTDPRALREWS
jgi:hypothetical protein